MALCEIGAVLGIPAGSYCNAEENKKYAFTALMMLRKNYGKCYNQIELWNEVLEELEILQKTHNQQMDVVLSLWNEGLLR